jgi:hypothetical protein
MSQKFGDSSATENEQQGPSTTVYQQKRELKGADHVEQDGVSLVSDNEDEKEDDEDKWLVVGTGKDEGNLSPIDSDRWLVVEALCAKWCSVLEDGSSQWDNKKIKNFLSQDELDDPALLRKLVHGTVVSGKLHPLIFEASTDEDDEKTGRMREVCLRRHGQCIR